MTNAQELVDQFRAIASPGSKVNTYKWANRITAELRPLGKSTIGRRDNRPGTYAIQVFECADGSRFAYDMDGAKQVWAMPKD